MIDERFDLSRRKILGSLGAVGAAGAVAGYGTSALFSDEESFGNDRLVAGELDLRVSWERHYSDWSDGEGNGVSVRMYGAPGSGTRSELPAGFTGLPANDAWVIAVEDPGRFLANTARGAFPDGDGDGLADAHPSDPDRSVDDPCRQLADVGPGEMEVPVVDVRDLKPGDFGEVTLGFASCDNPGFVWLDGSLRSAAENGVSEPESADPGEDGDPGSTDPADVELLDAVRAAVWVDDGDGYQDGDEAFVTSGSLRTVLAQLRAGRGLLLDGNLEDGADRGCFSHDRSGTGTADVHYVTLAWWLPVDHANELQTDSVTFDLGLYAEQCRHNRAGRAAGLRPATKLLAEERGPGAFFGAEVDVDGDRLVVSADGEGAGAAYVFGRSGGTWTRRARLTPAAPGGSDLFGESVALRGDTVVVGATGEDSNGQNAGAAYVFSGADGGWSQVARLTPPDPAAGDSFGQDVAVAGDRIVVGADGDAANGPESGAVYTFRREGGGWTEAGRLTPAGGRPGQYFGSRVAATEDGDVVVGAYGDGHAGENSGAAHVFTRDRDGWRRAARLVAPDASAGDFFGSGVAVDPGTVLVGAFGADAGTYAGAVYAFARPGATGGDGRPERLTPPASRRGDFFGWAVDVDGETAVVGAYGDDGPGRDAGTAYVYDRSGGTWTRRRRLARADAAAGDRFGVAVAADDGRLAVTADGDATAGPDTGGAYVYRTGGER